MNGKQLRLTGILLFVISAGLLIYSFRVAVAQSLYWNSKRNEGLDLWRAASRCEAAHAIYPFNYDACLYMANRALRDGRQPDGSLHERHLELAERWCGRGINAVNPYDRSMRMIWTDLLARKDLAQAIEYWEECVDEHFWHPENHARLAHLYSSAGRFEMAMDSLKWVKGSEYEEYAGSVFRTEWERFKKPPPNGHIPR